MLLACEIESNNRMSKLKGCEINMKEKRRGLRYRRVEKQE
jgi:hypothetical protein